MIFSPSQNSALCPNQKVSFAKVVKSLITILDSRPFFWVPNNQGMDPSLSWALHSFSLVPDTLDEQHAARYIVLHSWKTRLITMRSQPNYLRLRCYVVVVVVVVVVVADVVFALVVVLDVYFCCYGNIISWSEAALDWSWVCVVGVGCCGVQSHNHVKHNSVELSWGCVEVELRLWLSQCDNMLQDVLESLHIFFSCDEQLKTWRCHSVCACVHPLILLPWCI